MQPRLVPGSLGQLLQSRWHSSKRVGLLGGDEERPASIHLSRVWREREAQGGEIQGRGEDRVPLKPVERKAAPMGESRWCLVSIRWEKNILSY